MDAAEAVAIFAAGGAAGTINTIVGSGTLITFPVLLGFGYPPVTDKQEAIASGGETQTSTHNWLLHVLTSSGIVGRSQMPCPRLMPPTRSHSRDMRRMSDWTTFLTRSLI